MKNNRNLVILGVGIILSMGFIGFLIHDISLLPVKKAIAWCTSTASLHETKISMLLLTVSLGSFGLWLLRSIITMNKISRFPVTKNLPQNVSQLLRTMNLDKKVVIFHSDTQSAFCFGLLNQRIFISTALLNVVSLGELEAILLHEKYHLENRHFIERQLALCIAAVYPFIPIVRDFARSLTLRQEQRADQYASSQTNPAFLLSAFKKMVHDPSFDMAPGFSSLIEDRIYNFNTITSYNVKRSSVVVSLLFTLALAIIALSHPYSIHAQDSNLTHVAHGHMSTQTYAELSCEHVLMSRE